MAITTFRRYEKKFLLGKAQYRDILEKIAPFTEKDKGCMTESGEYTVSNLYFDTDENSVIRQSLSKPYYKEKLRLRTYALPAKETDNVFLEMKKKCGGLVGKRRAVLTLSEARDFLSTGKYPEQMSYITRQVLREISFFLSRNKVSPKAYISYKRIAFTGKEDPSLRITFDRDILTRRRDLSLSSPRYGEFLLPTHTYLMEVKVSKSIPIWLCKILSEEKTYTATFSKYGNEYKKHLLMQPQEDGKSIRKVI